MAVAIPGRRLSSSATSGPSPSKQLHRKHCFGSQDRARQRVVLPDECSLKPWKGWQPVRKMFALLMAFGLICSLGFGTVGCNKKETKKEETKTETKKDGEKTET